MALDMKANSQWLKVSNFDASKGRNSFRPLWSNWVPPEVFFWLEVLNRRIPLIMALRARDNSTRVGYDRFGYNWILEPGMGSGINTQF
ncbi:hypothetical protein Hdeb2414_s0011g00360071 [Helianthus debilis subsp. tardiflorus]